MTVPYCPEPGVLVETRIERVLTQYRESPALLAMMRIYMTALAETALRVCDLPERFDIDSATGDQLTLVGKRLGWPRCHCTYDVQSVFGFECEDAFSLRPLVGFSCEPGDLSSTGTWSGCTKTQGRVCIDDDDIYRGFLMARRYQALARFDIESLTAAAKALFGERAAVVSGTGGRAVIWPGRRLSEAERQLVQLYPRVLPVAPGIKALFHLGDRPPFGFGSGWGGFCAPDEGAWLCPVDVNPFQENTDG